jgi:DNA-binding CsgD family transcriptional regulator/tetratricopeptide (TPR) repeat protein
VNQSFARFIVFSCLVLLPPLLFAQGSNRVPDKLLEAIRSASASEFGALSEFWELFHEPATDPVALVDDVKARLQPIKPKSELEYNMAFITMFAHDLKHKDSSIIKPFLDTLLQLGLSFNNLQIQAHATWAYGAHLRPHFMLDEVATYYLLSIQLYEQLPFFERMYAKYGALAEVLFQTGDYRPSVEYGHKALKGEDWIREHYDYFTLIRYLNTMGQAYFKLGIADSAAYYYGRSKQLAAEKKSAQWVAINESFEGQLYLIKGEPRQAFSLFQKGYLANRAVDPPMESFSLTGMGKALFDMGQFEKAKPLLWQGLHAANQSDNTSRLQVAHYRKDALATLAGLYQKQNRQDSFYYYFLEANRLEDSLVKVASLSNLRMAEIRAEVEQSRMQVAKAAEQKERERWMRNLIIAGIVVAASVIILFLSRRNRILQLEKQMADVKQQASDAEMTAAREQLDLFTRSLQDKTQLLDKLQQQATTDDNGFQSEIIQDLTRQAILTEDDWQYFRTSFDKIYPGFFMRLRQAAPDITMAEQRMAALTLLKMNGREMAAILGISPESVRKTRQRLRQRLQLGADDDLVASLASLT